MAHGSGTAEEQDTDHRIAEETALSSKFNGKAIWRAPWREEPECIPFSEHQDLLT